MATPTPTVDDTTMILQKLHDLSMQLQASNCDQSAELKATSERRGFNDEIRQTDNTKHILARVVDYGRETNQNIRNQGSDSKNQTIYESGEIRHDQEEIAALLALNYEKVHNDLVGYIQGSSNRANDQYNDTKWNLASLHADVGDYFNDTQTAVLSQGISLERQSAAEFEQTQTGLVKVESSLGRLGDHNTANLEIQGIANYGQVQIQALQLNNTMTREMEECCCALKEKVFSNEQHVSDLLYNNQADDLRLRLVTLSFRNDLLRHSPKRRSPSRSRSRGRSRSHVSPSH